MSNSPRIHLAGAPTLAAAMALVLTTGSVAQQPPAPMSEQQMQAMMAYGQAVQACAAGVDQAGLQARAEKAHQEVVGLCAAGKRDEAQSKAMDFARELDRDPAMKAMHACMKKAEALKPDIPGMESPAATDFTQIDSSTQVCDDL